VPGRPAQPVLVLPSQVPQRSIATVQGRAALLHALAHIEFNAINLALDALWRFSGMPPAYYTDWLQVAAEEATHFSLLREHLQTLGHDYGDFAGHDGTCRIGTATAAIHAQQFSGLEVHDTESGQHEKNWMPILGQRKWLYSCHMNGKVATATPEDGRWAIELWADAPPIARGFRGGSQLVDVGDGLHLALVHEVAHDKDGRRTYEHRFVAFDSSDWSISAISPAFAFRETRAIEFAAGLAHRVGQLVASFGVRDCEAWLVEMRLSDVLPLLEPVA
jgi:hypothetical protein